MAVDETEFSRCLEVDTEEADASADYDEYGIVLEEESDDYAYNFDVSFYKRCNFEAPLKLVCQERFE